MSTDTKTESTPDKLQLIKDDRSQALRAPKNIGEAEHPDGELIEQPRTAVRFRGVDHGVPQFDFVTTKLTGFPIGTDIHIVATQDEIVDWMQQNSVSVIDAATETWKDTS